MTSSGFKGATPEGAVTTTHRYEVFWKTGDSASKEPHPKVRLQPRTWGNRSGSGGASKEPHPKVRLQHSASSNGCRVSASKEPHPKVRLQPPGCTGREGKGVPGFKGATPEGAVTTRCSPVLLRAINCFKGATPEGAVTTFGGFWIFF